MVQSARPKATWQDVPRQLVPLLLLALLVACRTREAPPGPPSEPSAAGPPVHASPQITTSGTAHEDSAPTADLEGMALTGKDTHAIIVGVLEFAEPGVAGWSKERRKDRALYETLRARGVPEQNIALLLDTQADHRSVMAAVERVSRRADADDTLLFYYAGHGMRDTAGAPHFLAYDSRGGAMSQTGIAVSAVADRIADHFRGRRVFLMADACYSGALKEAAQQIAKRGVQAASLTSAEASNLSTNNWTFTQTVLDGLAGDALMDGDADGRVSLDELAEAVADAMKYREKQRHGFFRAGLDEGLPLAKAKGKVTRGDDTLAVGQYVLAPRDGSRAVAQIRGAGPDDRLVRFYDYNRGHERRVKTSALEPLTFERHPPGQALRVYWGGKLWDAKVLRREGDFHLITYPGWGPEWNEWVMSDRIASSGGTTEARIRRPGDR